MPDFDEIGRALEKSGQAERLRQLADSPEGRRLSAMLDGAAVSQAAKNGDTKTLQAILQQVLRTGEGQALAQKLQDSLRK